MDRFRDNAVDQRVHPYAIVLQIADERVVCVPLLCNIDNEITQCVAVTRYQFAREQGHRLGARDKPVVQQDRQLGGKTARDRLLLKASRNVVFKGCVAGIAGIRHDHLDVVPYAFAQRWPVIGGVEGFGDRVALNGDVDSRRALLAADPHGVHARGAQRVDPRPAFRIRCALHDGNPSERLRRLTSRSLRNEQIDMRLEKAARAELENRIAHRLYRSCQHSTSALITPADGSSSFANSLGKSLSLSVCVFNAAVGMSPARMAFSTVSKSSGVALRLASSVVSRL